MQLNLGQKIRELRRRDGRTQEALAEALGVTSQAVSRWESGGSYPDMEIIPSIANYFGVSIDELFGYDNERSLKIDTTVERINGMNRLNNGEDVNIDECVALAREALIEFPGNEKIMLCLASVLNNAGYVRYGEHHLCDEEGYDVYDVEKHRTYPEWKEAISLYEKLLKTMEYGELRHHAVGELTQLYLNTGEYNRAVEIIDNMPSIYETKDFLQVRSSDGKNRAKAYQSILLKLVRVSSELMVSCVLAQDKNITATEKVNCIRGAIEIFDTVCIDGNYGEHHAYVARVYSLLSLYLWQNHQQEQAFEALDKALGQLDNYADHPNRYTAPLVRLLSEDNDGGIDVPKDALVEDWPWWRVEGWENIKKEMEKDPRWKEWVSKVNR